MKIKEINIENKSYPKQLRMIKEPPKRLYVLGNEKILNNECFSIVGSRNCTEYGADVARSFANQLAQKRYNYC